MTQILYRNEGRTELKQYIAVLQIGGTIPRFIVLFACFTFIFATHLSPLTRTISQGMYDSRQTHSRICEIMQAIKTLGM